MGRQNCSNDDVGIVHLSMFKIYFNAVINKSSKVGDHLYLGHNAPANQTKQCNKQV